MKKTLNIFYLFFLLIVSINSTYANDKMTQITCNMLRSTSNSSGIIRDYVKWNFYIDDINKELYYAPSGKSLNGSCNQFDDNFIMYENVPMQDFATGTISIERNSGTIRMNFVSTKSFSKFTKIRTNYIGECNKVDETKKF